MPTRRCKTLGTGKSAALSGLKGFGSEGNGQRHDLDGLALAVAEHAAGHDRRVAVPAGDRHAAFSVSCIEIDGEADAHVERRVRFARLDWAGVDEEAENR